MELQIDYPVCSVTPGTNSHEVLIGGGGGRGNYGVPNHIAYGEIDSSGKLTITKKEKYDDIVRCLTTSFCNNRYYISFINGSDIIVLCKQDRTNPLKTISLTPEATKNASSEANTDDEKYFTSLSTLSNLLVCTDEKSKLYIYNFPKLIEICSSPENSFKKAKLIKSINNNILILCISKSKVKLLKPTKKLRVVAESEYFNYDLKDVLAIENDIYLLMVKERRQSFIVKLKHEKDSLKTVKQVCCPHDAFCSICINNDLLLLGNSEGDLAIFDRHSLKKKKTFPRIHSISITSICVVDDFIVTGSLDNTACVTQYVDNSSRKTYVIILIFILVSALFCFKIFSYY